MSETANVEGDVFKAGNVVSIYISGSGLSTAQAICTLLPEFRPKHAYVIMPVYDSASPYAPITGSVWIHSSGRIEKYGTGSGQYCFGTYVTE